MSIKNFDYFKKNLKTNSGIDYALKEFTYYTLNLKLIISPSSTIYSFPIT